MGIECSLENKMSMLHLSCLLNSNTGLVIAYLSKIGWMPNMNMVCNGGSTSLHAIVVIFMAWLFL